MKRATVLILALLLSFVPAWSKDASTDGKIHDQVMLKLAGDPDVKGSNFEITVQDGVVTLRGAISQEKFKAKAEHLTRKVKGVKSVVDELTVRPQ